MKTPGNSVAVRWTLGDVSHHGFEALKLSIWSAHQLFPPDATLAVCVNTIPVETAKQRTGEIPSRVVWVNANERVPEWLRFHVDGAMAEGVAWKLAPVRLFPDRFEISLDNDVVLWEIPPAMAQWLESVGPDHCLLAEDTQRSLGQFSGCPDGRAINSGIRGLPPGYDYETDLREVLRNSGITLRSELDEQGLQAATLSRKQLRLVSKQDVTICSPLPMHQQHLGRCGAHFVGLNPKSVPWTDADGRPLNEVIGAAWVSYRDEIEARISVAAAPQGPLPA